MTNDVYNTAWLYKSNCYLLYLLGIDVFMIDEAPMHLKSGLLCMDQGLHGDGDRSLPFGAKIIIMGGDFSHRKGTRSEHLNLSIRNVVYGDTFSFYLLIKTCE